MPIKPPPHPSIFLLFSYIFSLSSEIAWGLFTWFLMLYFFAFPSFYFPFPLFLFLLALSCCPRLDFSMALQNQKCMVRDLFERGVHV